MTDRATSKRFPRRKETKKGRNTGGTAIDTKEPRAAATTGTAGAILCPPCAPRTQREAQRSTQRNKEQQKKGGTAIDAKEQRAAAATGTATAPVTQAGRDETTHKRTHQHSEEVQSNSYSNNNSFSYSSRPPDSPRRDDTPAAYTPANRPIGAPTLLRQAPGWQGSAEQGTLKLSSSCRPTPGSLDLKATVPERCRPTTTRRYGATATATTTAMAQILPPRQLATG